MRNSSINIRVAGGKGRAKTKRKVTINREAEARVGAMLTRRTSVYSS